MDTPICDFVKNYCDKNMLRFHMPGHKGQSFIGPESLDITEIEAADSLYEANGIIQKSEQNAGFLFGCDTFYSAEGSSLCIRAMLYMACLYAKKSGKRPVVAAGRNAHKTFLTAAAFLDFDILWLYPEKSSSYLSCEISANVLETALISAEETPSAVYITSPDYLGNISNIKALATVCKKHGVLLIVDNAHGAYLKFLEKSLHPIDMGADMCCDSAHKTLPVLTGGAYMHISKNAPKLLRENAKNAMALFGSTSPSYLILQSLDAANKYISDGYQSKLLTFIESIKVLKNQLLQRGFSIYGNEELKITIKTKKYGYTGYEFAALLAEKNIVCEFFDPDFVVLMLTPELGTAGLKMLKSALFSIEKKEPGSDDLPQFCAPKKIMSVREACLSESEIIDCKNSEGRVLAAPSAGCPPAVSIVMCGEQINASAIKCFEYYGIKTCRVVKE